MLGRVLKRLGHADKALLSLNIAMDLANPKDRSVVKSGMRTLPSMLHVVWDKAVFFTTMMSACVVQRSTSCTVMRMTSPRMNPSAIRPRTLHRSRGANSAVCA